MMRRAFALLSLLLAGGLSAAVYLLRVEEVRVTGLQVLPARAVVDASGIEPGDRILWERMTAAERRVEQIPSVARAVVERSLPGTVVIHVREREPIARLDGATDLAVDREGVIFPVGDAVVRPVLYGWKGRARAGLHVDPDARRVLEAYPDFPDYLLEWGRRIRVGETFVLRLVGGTEVRFGALRDLEAKARIAVAIIRREKGVRLAYVDVRSPTVAVARPAASPTPDPSPTPPSSPVSGF